jgi:hypothetical protein
MNGLQKLIADTAEKCISNKIDFLLKRTPTVLAEDTIECSGYFDEESLVVATGKGADDWLPILLHESCHLDQFIEKVPIWKDGESSIDCIDAWLCGKNFSKKKIIKHIQSVINLELDCEKRTAKKIVMYDFDIDITLYIQRANAYIFSYWATFRDRQWFKFPYNNVEIYSNMPDRFLTQEEYNDPNTEFLKFYI